MAAMDQDIPDKFIKKDNSFVAECLDCGLVIRTDNLGENESVQSAHDSMSVEGSCSSRSSSTHSEDHMFKKVGGDIHVPSESLAHCQRRQYFKGKWLQFSATLLKPIDDEPTDYRKGVDKATLIEENEKLRLSSKCKVCKRRPATVVVYPCRHRAMCENCVAPRERCNICSQPISSKIKYSDHPGSFN